MKIIGVPGQTKLLIDVANSGAFNISNSENIEINGVTIDHEQLPFTQGRILAVNGQSFDIEIQAGFDEPDAAQFQANIYEGISSAGFIYKANADEVKIEDHNIYVSIAKQTAQKLGPRTWRFLTYNGNLPSFLSAGDRLALSFIGTNAISSAMNTNLTLKSVVIHSASYMGVVCLGNRGVTTIDGLQIVPAAGRLLSVNADALHVLESRAQLILKNSIFKHQGDDALNIKASSFKVSSVSGADVVLPRSHLDFEVGDEVQFTSPFGDMKSTAIVTDRLQGEFPKVASIKVEGDLMYVRLDRIIQGRVFAGDTAFSLNLASPNSVVSNNTYYDYRGSIRFRAYKGAFVKNTFKFAGFAKILLTVDSYWPEGPWGVTASDISANTVDGGKLLLYGDDWKLIGER
ncbi:MAG: hypothetical protein EOP04_09910 [Proteobacteria bacterium]|nr:MAG: hypothetical protein EOP04_09910 [Pseudomonadota bacterium]